MTFKTIRIQRDGPIATGTLTRPDRLNAFGYEMMEEVTEAARIFRKDHDAHAIVLPGEKRAFSSGFDLTQSSPSGSVAQRREHHHSGREMCRAWERLHVLHGGGCVHAGSLATTR